MKRQAGNHLWTNSLPFTFHNYPSLFLFFIVFYAHAGLGFTPHLPSSSLSSIWGQQRWRTQGISHHLREEANPLCPNFNWATNPPGLSKQWAPSAADKLACPPPCSLLSRAGLGPASVTVSNSWTTHLHRKCELLTKWPTCLQRACTRCNRSVSTNQTGLRRNDLHLVTVSKGKLTVSARWSLY